MTARFGTLAIGGAIAVLAAIVGVGAGPVGPAAAASGDLTVSADGVTYADSTGASLFTSIERLIPGDRDDARVHLRNNGDASGYLRIVLGDVTYTDLDFANALTIRATADGVSGAPVPFSLAEPCWVLIEGTVVAPGQAVAIDTELVLGNLDGTQGQGARVTGTLIASLSDTTPGSIAPTECGRDDVSVPVTPLSNPRSTFVNQNDPGGDGSDGLIPGVIPELPVLNLPDLLGIDPNTWRLFEELFVFVLGGAMLVGGIWFALVRRRRHRDDSPLAHEEGSP